MAGANPQFPSPATATCGCNKAGKNKGFLLFPLCKIEGRQG